MFWPAVVYVRRKSGGGLPSRQLLKLVSLLLLASGTLYLSLPSSYNQTSKIWKMGVKRDLEEKTVEHLPEENDGGLKRSWGQTSGTQNQQDHHSILAKDWTPLRELSDTGDRVLYQQQQPFPFSYLLNEPSVCEEEEEEKEGEEKEKGGQRRKRRGVDIINVIPIKPDNYMARQRIRKLWARRDLAQLTGMRTVFFMGLAVSEHQQYSINNESCQHHDIVQLDFVDSYRNLTLKTVSMLHWALNFCPGAQWILKSDEDVLVNPFAIKNYLKHHLGYHFVCRINTHLKVCRIGTKCEEKWAVTLEEYPQTMYPPYCDGPAYMVTTTMAALLYSAANKTHPHFIEDAYITGIIADQFQPKYLDITKYRFLKKRRRLHSNYWNGYALFMQDIHLNMKLQNAVWERILQYNKVSLNLAQTQGNETLKTT